MYESAAKKRGRLKLRLDELRVDEPRASAPDDDPRVVRARERLVRWEALDQVLEPLGETPYFIDSADGPRIIAELRDFGCTVRETDVAGLDDDAAVIRLGEALEFPDWWGENWGAYMDCHSMLVDGSDASIVLAVRGFDEMKASDFRRFFRTVYEMEVVNEWTAKRSSARGRVVNLYIGDWG